MEQLLKWILIIVMLGHGLIHLMGGVNELGLAKVSAISGKTLLPLSESMHFIFGMLWLIAVILFVISAIGLITNQSWWKNLAIAAAVLSQLLIIVWWPDAKWGTAANALIVAGSLFLKI